MLKILRHWPAPVIRYFKRSPPLGTLPLFPRNHPFTTRQVQYMNFVTITLNSFFKLWTYFSILFSVLNLFIKIFYNIITVLLWVSIRSLFCNHMHFSPTTFISQISTTQNITNCKYVNHSNRSLVTLCSIVFLPCSEVLHMQSLLDSEFGIVWEWNIIKNQWILPLNKTLWKNGSAFWPMM